MKTQNLLQIGGPSLRVLFTVAALALGAAGSQVAMAAPHDGHSAGGHGPRGDHAGMMERGGPGMPMSPRHMERLLDGVKATAEQRAQIKQITEAAHAEMATLRDSGRKLHEQERALFAQPTVDARNAEVLRQQKLAHHDQASKRMLQMKLEISRVLSPEQRAQISAHMNERMHKRMGMGKGMMERHQQGGMQDGKPSTDRPRS